MPISDKAVQQLFTAYKTQQKSENYIHHRVLKSNKKYTRTCTSVCEKFIENRLSGKYEDKLVDL